MSGKLHKDQDMVYAQVSTCFLTNACCKHKPPGILYTGTLFFLLYVCMIYEIARCTCVEIMTKRGTEFRTLSLSH